MAEIAKINPVVEGLPVLQDAISALSRKLGIQDAIITEINKLSDDRREEIEIDLISILKEVEVGKLGTTDRDQRIKNILEGEYRIITKEENKSEITNGMSLQDQKETNLSILLDKNESKFEKLQKNLESVKSLDPMVVSEELTKAKSEKPLPEEAKTAIAKSTSSTPEQVDAAIKSGDNPQITNLIDTYYLSQGNTVDAIAKRLPEGKITTEFQELRASARAFGLPYTERADNVRVLITNQSDKTQSQVIETVNSLTKGAPDTLITREGDRLSWQDQNGSQYEIDMTVRPPKLTKSLGTLSLSRVEQTENPEVVTLQQAVTAQKTTVEKSGSEIRKSLDSSGVYGFNPANYSPDEIRQLFAGESISTFQEKLNNANTPEQQVALRQELESARIGSTGKLSKVAIQYMEYILDDRIQLGATGIGGGVGESVSSRDWRDKLSSLKDLQSGDKLEQYAREQEILEQREKELGLVQSPGVESFDDTAQATLERLNTLGLGQIGQENLDTLIQGLAARDGQRGIWENGRINMDDMRVREMQLQDLTQVSSTLQVARRNNPGTQDENSLGIVYGDISRMIRGNEDFRKMWNTPNQLALWISKQGAPRVAGEEKV